MIKAKLIEHIERFLFSIKWMLIPLYLGLVFALGLYIIHFMHEIFDMYENFMANYKEQNVLMLFILELVDMTMISQLVVMTIQGGYLIFVKEFDYSHLSERPKWLTGSLSSSDQKIKMGMSIIGVMLVHFLRDFIQSSKVEEHELMMRLWIMGAVIIGTFAVCGFNILMHLPMLNHSTSADKQKGH